MHDTNTLRQDEPAGRHALAFVTAAAALIAALLTTEARAQSDALEAERAAAWDAYEAAFDASRAAFDASRAAFDAYLAAREAALDAALFVAPAATVEALKAPWNAYLAASNASQAAWDASQAARLGLDVELVAKARGCAGETAETLATIIREFPDYQKRTMEMLLTGHERFQESPTSAIAATGWSDREAVLWECGAADEVSSLLRALRRGNFEFADSFMAAARAGMQIQMQLRSLR